MLIAPPTPETLLIAASSSLVKLTSTATGLGVLAFIVVVHEAGHFLAARLQGIRVKDFSIGFGPQLLSFKPKNSETQFTLRLLPLGGYVAFPEHTQIDEETGEESESTDPNLLQNRPILDRAIVISAGVIANIMLAYFTIFASVNVIGVPSFQYQPGVVMTQIDPNGAASQFGLQKGDVIVSVDGTALEAVPDSASKLAAKIRSSQGNPLQFEVLRGGSGEEKKVLVKDVRAKCCSPSGDSMLGVQLSANAKLQRVHPESVYQSVQLSSREFGRLLDQTVGGLLSLIKNSNGQGTQNLSGPVGVISIGADLARNDQAGLLTFIAVISMNLAVINALPLPALDGGQMAFILVEAVRGEPVSMKVQEKINRVALLFFLLLSGSLLFGDLEKLGNAASSNSLPPAK